METLLLEPSNIKMNFYNDLVGQSIFKTSTSAKHLTLSRTMGCPHVAIHVKSYQRPEIFGLFDEVSELSRYRFVLCLKNRSKHGRYRPAFGRNGEDDTTANILEVMDCQRQVGAGGTFSFENCSPSDQPQPHHPLLQVKM